VVPLIKALEPFFKEYAMHNNQLLMVYITNPSEQKAQEIAKHLLEKKLIACANVLSAPVHSMCVWEGRVAQEDEVVLIAKTVPALFDELVQEVQAMHPYSVPCIMAIPAHANAKFVEFVVHAVTR
jgi:periplasmic divalent cation tolerance protein